jgi:hypothetical protein
MFEDVLFNQDRNKVLLKLGENSYTCNFMYMGIKIYILKSNAVKGA